MLALHFLYRLAAFLHQPLGRGGGTTDANGLDAIQPLLLNLTGILYQVGVRIDAQTFVEEYLAITALPSADKEDKIVAGGKLRDIRHTVGYRTTDRIEALEGGIWGDMGLDVVDDAMKLVKRLRGLAIEIDITGEIEFLHLVETLDDDSGAVGLSYQSENFGMTFLAKDDDLGGSDLPCPLL